MSIEKYKYWDEFDWEVEFKQEDHKISAYTSELTNFIDLPDEAEIILKHLQKSHLTVPTLVWNESDWGFDGENEEDIDLKNSLVGTDFYLNLGRLASEFSRTMSECINISDISVRLQALCLYGEIMSRSLDLIEIIDADIPSLKIALGKRISSKINHLIGIIDSLSTNDKPNRTLLKNQIYELLRIREKLLNIR